MTDQPDSPHEPAEPLAADPPEADPGLERRAFVRRMGTDAVRTAGSVFSLSRILTRSAVAASQAVVGELEAIQMGNSAEEPALPAAAAEAEGAGAPPQPVSAAEVAIASPSPHRPATLAVAIEAEQREILEAAASAVVAVNRAGHPPQLTTAAVLWDGELIRFATLGWSRRTTMLRADPHIGLLIDSPGDSRYVTMIGRASIVEGHEAREATQPLLLRETGSAEAADARWLELVAADRDRAVIIVEPQQVLSGRR